jgi:hypothetical protein
MINQTEINIASLKETILISNQVIADAIAFKLFDNVDMKMDQQMKLIGQLIALYAEQNNIDRTDLQSYLENVLQNNNLLRVKIQEEREAIQKSFRNINNIKEYVTS